MLCTGLMHTPRYTAELLSRHECMFRTKNTIVSLKQMLFTEREEDIAEPE